MIESFSGVWFFAGALWALVIVLSVVHWKRRNIGDRLTAMEGHQASLIEKATLLREALDRLSEPPLKGLKFELELYRLKLPEFDTYNGLWAFDDQERGLNAEPFFPEATLVIDTWAKRLGIKTDRLKLTFSSGPFNESTETFWQLDTIENQATGGSNYYAPRDGLRFWLCPALLKFFPALPMTIWARLDPV